MRRLLLLVLICTAMSSGCTMLKWAHPRHLWKLNRQPAMMRDDAYFSIPADPVPSLEMASTPIRVKAY